MEDPRLLAEVAAHPFPLLFATVSGAHLYGFPSRDSDFDLRGTHVAPTVVLTGLERIEETVKSSTIRDEMEVDLVTHEVRKFFTLLLRNNGYVLEQLYSPLVVQTTPEHDELKEIARGCISRACVRHYLGFAANQWLLFTGESPHRLKPLLYVYRVLLSGIYLMRTGCVNANLRETKAELGAGRLNWIDELIAHKIDGEERSTLLTDDLTFYEQEYVRLRLQLSTAAECSALPDGPTAAPALKDLLRRLRERELHLSR
jgi:predicted nucleotidyltransferase